MVNYFGKEQEMIDINFRNLTNSYCTYGSFLRKLRLLTLITPSFEGSRGDGRYEFPYNC